MLMFMLMLILHSNVTLSCYTRTPPPVEFPLPRPLMLLTNLMLYSHVAAIYILIILWYNIYVIYWALFFLPEERRISYGAPQNRF